MKCQSIALMFRLITFKISSMRFSELYVVFSIFTVRDPVRAYFIIFDKNYLVIKAGFLRMRAHNHYTIDVRSSFYV